MNEELSELLKVRQEKLQDIKGQGVNPYPYRFEKTHHSTQLITEHKALEQQETPVATAGRIISKRDSGKTSFAHIQDEFGKIQIYVRKDEVGEPAFNVFKLLDLGDIIGVKGKVFVTRTGEVSVFVNEVTVLSKSLRPLPVVKEKDVDGQKVVYDQVTDKESRYRQRYVDLNVNTRVREVFKQRARIISLIRTFLDERGYLEVETPALQPLYGGAAARPFKTHHNALDIPLYLRISDELYLKRLIIGGYEKVYEICKDFRNEGMDRSHNPEFTMLEAYQAYADYTDMMQLAEGLVCHVAQALNNSYQLVYQGKEFDLTPPWKRIRFVDAIQEKTGVDITGKTADQLRTVCKELGIETDKESDPAGLIDAIFSEKIEPHLIQPTFLTDYPVATTALAKRHRSNPELVERFEIFINGREMGNAFSELNDPQEQRDRFNAGIEGNVVDEDFLRALEHGMPPTGGLGLGIDRWIMLFTDAFSIRDVLFFPQMRPEE